MRQRQIDVKPIGATGNRFDRVIEWLVIALLAFMPLAFGAVEAWSEEVVVALAAAISVTFAVKLLLNPNTRLVWSWAYVPVGLFILVAVFQLLPLPEGMVATISPHTAAVKQELLSDLPNSDSLTYSMTLSFYPNATKHDLRLVLAAAAVFVVVLNVLRRPEQIKRLLAAISIIGGGIALLALAQIVSGTEKIYWHIPTGYTLADAGTFINHSHFGQFMNLSIGAALGLIMVKLHEAFTGKKVTPVLVFEWIGSQATARAIWLLVAVIILGIAAVFMSLTRGGMVSMLIAAGFTILILTSRQSLKGSSWIMVLVALGAFICVLYIGFDAVYDRLATLRELHEYKGRWQIVKDISVAWTRFPLLGAGLGTHEVVYPMFDRSTIPAMASHAENEYAQAAEETGLAGLALLSALCATIWVSYTRCVKSACTPIRSAAYGLGFGLLAIMLHSLSDFGQHLPANFMLSAIFGALLIGLARTGRQDQPAPQINSKPTMRRPVSIVVLVCVSAAWFWALSGADGARVAEAHWKKALTTENNLRQKNWQGTNDEFKELISHAAAAADCQPENVKYHHWLNVYRWRSISRITDPNTGQVIIPEQMTAFVPRIVTELHKARQLCPVFGATYCVAGQLEKFVLDDPNGTEHIQKGYRLAPCDPTACFVAGFLDAEGGHTDAAFAKLERAVQLDGRLFGEVANICVNDMNRPDLAVTLAGENTGRLSRVANILINTGEHEELAKQARIQVIKLLKAKCQQPDAPAWAFASVANIYRKEGDNEAAIEYYHRALALDYGQVDWRFVLARLLAETDRIPEAIHEARICLRLRPQMNAAEKLIEDLSVLPGAMSEDK